MVKQLLGVVFERKEKIVYYHKLWYFFLKNIRAELAGLFLNNRTITNFKLFEQRFYSQNGEDGILKLIFNKLGTTNRFCVEFGIHPHEGNTLYLKEQQWDCLWMDGKGDGNIIKKEMITAENINALFHKYSVPEEFDLLSIDIDSNDYWVWKALTGYSPRVVVMEFNSSIPPTESKTILYDPMAHWDGTNYFGASLLALKKLGESKGYSLIACEQSGTNAFFIRNDLIKNHFKVETIEKIYVQPAFGRKVNGKRIGHPASTKSMITV